MGQVDQSMFALLLVKKYIFFVLVFLMTKAVSNRDICVLKQCYYGDNTCIFDKFFVALLKLPPPLVYD